MKIVLAALFVSATALAQPQEFPVQPLPPPEPVVHPDRYVGVHAGVNVGLFAIDVQVNRFYAYAAAGAGITLLTNNRFGAFAAGLGYSVTIKDNRKGRWKVDLLLMTTPGWVTGGWPNISEIGARIPYVGVGAGVGFRWEADSGFSIGFKIPIFGYAISSVTNRSSASGVGLFYVSSGAALPIISFGYRF